MSGYMAEYCPRPMPNRADGGRGEAGERALICHEIRHGALLGHYLIR